DLSGHGGLCGVQGFFSRMLGSPRPSRSFKDSTVATAPLIPGGWCNGVERAGPYSSCAASETPGWRSFSAGLSRAARCFPSGVTSGRAALERGVLFPLADFGALAMPPIWAESGADQMAGMARSWGKAALFLLRCVAEKLTRLLDIAHLFSMRTSGLSLKPCDRLRPNRLGRRSA